MHPTSSVGYLLAAILEIYKIEFSAVRGAEPQQQKIRHFSALSHDVEAEAEAEAEAGARRRRQKYLRLLPEERREALEVRGLRVRGVLQRRVPKISLGRPQRNVQAEAEGEEGARGEGGSAEQWQWQWLGRHRHGVSSQRSDAAASTAAISRSGCI